MTSLWYELFVFCLCAFGVIVAFQFGKDADARFGAYKMFSDWI